MFWHLSHYFNMGLYYMGVCVFFLIQFNVPFKIISLISRRANRWWGETGVPRENHRTYPQAELGLGARSYTRHSGEMIE